MKREVGHFSRNTKFKGITNEEIMQLRKEKDQIEVEYKKKLKVIEDRIREIQKNCDHKFQFTSEGIENDYYCCPLCGEKDWS